MKGTRPHTVISTTRKRKEPEEPTGKIGTSLSTKLSIAGHGKELEGKLKTLKLKEEKSTWPVPEFSASDPEEELAELRLKLQGMEVTSPSAVYFTTGHEKEKILRHETMKLQEKKGILPLSEEEPEGLLMKLQRRKGILPLSEEELEELLMKLQSMKDTSLSTKLSTAGHGKELEGKLKTMTLQEEKRTWPVREFCASDPEEDLAAELPMKLQGMEVTSPSAAYLTTGHEKEKKGTSLSTKLSTVGHGKELEGKLKTMKLQEEKSILPLSEEEPEGLLMKLQRMKGTSLSAKLSTAGHGKELEGKMKTLKLQEEKKLEGRLKTFTLQEEKRTSLSTKLSTVGHGKELEGRLKTMTLQEEKRTSLSTKLSTVGHGKELEGKL
ncbi:uncharacterized protein LOC111343436, partial [Stylophora pistillata]|uniref:uncharacterized protein LOC111343436 n=1 Tax=Stylophora pistillata TaxID=50429 RepID=UPI000C054098